jgi:hypothetical protein
MTNAIAENVEILRRGKAVDEAAYQELVKSGRPLESSDMLTVFMAGKTPEEYRADAENAQADIADAKCVPEAQRVTAGPLREAQREVNEVDAQIDLVGRVFQAIANRVYAALAERQQQARARSTDCWYEVGRLRGAPNRKNLADRKRYLDELRGQLHSAEQAAKETADGHDYNSSLHVITDLRKQLAAAEAQPFVFSAEANIPPELPSFDLVATVIAIAVDELQRAIPLGQRGDVFGRVAAAFKEANPAECLAEYRRIVAEWEEAAKSSDEREARKQD